LTNDLLPVIVPWVLTILLHPNTDDPASRSRLLTLSVNRSQPGNAYNMKTPCDNDGKTLVEKILPNVTLTVRLEF
jgi:hypothetical protein